MGLISKCQSVWHRPAPPELRDALGTAKQEDHRLGGDE